VIEGVITKVLGPHALDAVLAEARKLWKQGEPADQRERLLKERERVELGCIA
jgi:hypothetical protein